MLDEHPDEAPTSPDALDRRGVQADEPELANAR
jgi:hypothetical protein